MRHVRHHRLSVPILALVAIALGAPGRARADVLSAAYAGSQSYVYEINHMPDFDQKRVAGPGAVGLPNDGKMYCAPTASCNLLAYIANHGFAGVMPGSGNWQSQGKYNEAGLSIDLLGVWMGTNPATGTGRSGWISGLGTALGQHPFILTAYTASGNYSPTQASMALTASQGGVVAFSYGRYHIISEAGDTVVVGVRASGHVVTLARTIRSGAIGTIAARNPGDGGDDFTQSMFNDNEWTARDHTIANLVVPYVRTKTSIDHPMGDGLIRLIDTVLAITPKHGYSFSPSEIELFYPVIILGSPPPGLSYTPPSEVLDAVPGPDHGRFFVIVQGPPEAIVSINRATGETEQITEMPGARCMTFGRTRELYVADVDRLYCLDIDADDPIVTSVPLPDPVEAMTYDDAADELVLFSISNGKILRYKNGLPNGIPPSIYDITGATPREGLGAIAVNPADQGMWWVTEASPVLHSLHVDDAGVETWGQVTLTAVTKPNAIDFDDDGVMYVTDEDRVEVFEEQVLGWSPLVSSEFQGHVPAGQFRMVRSRDNYDPATMSGPGWDNIAPEDLVIPTQIEDCLGDFDADALITVADLLELLARWGTADPYADIAPNGGDGIVDVLDLLAFLAAWGPCP